ncbi:MAG: hypothetical protein N2Z70_02815 [Bdellovibrionaceae bacterium]|jgi:hypothetical protein|nr:hypothetical protein [Pseudobdellovibrionaceae bacterium]
MTLTLMVCSRAILFGVIGSTWIFSASSLRAQELRTYHQSIRALGMGGVRVAYQHEAQALAWNPAYLGFNSGFNVTLADAGAGLNGLQAYESFKDVDLSQGLSGLNGVYGKPLWLGAWGWAAVSWSFAGAYYLSFYDLTVLLKDPGVPKMDVSYYQDDFYILGFGYQVLEGFSIGANIKRVERIGGDITFDTAQLLSPGFVNNLVSNIESTLNAHGQAFGADIGVAYRWKRALNPTLSLAWQDVGYTSFAPSDPTKPMAPIRDNLILSGNFHDSWMGFRLGGGFEYRHIRNDDEQLGKKIHLGLELGLPFVDLRAGLYQGYTSYGVGLDIWLLRFDAAWFRQEMGVFPGQTPQERIMLSLNMDLSLDPDLRLREDSGRRRRLFQRR